MKKIPNSDGTIKRYVLTWKDFAKFVPENVKLLMEQYSQEHVTPFVTIGAETGDMTCGTPIWANLKHDPNVKPPTWQVVSDEQKESLHAKGLVSWKEAVEIFGGHEGLLANIHHHNSFFKFKEVDGVQLTIPRAHMVALRRFIEDIGYCSFAS